MRNWGIGREIWKSLARSALVFGVPLASQAADNPEIEPNETKALATPMTTPLAAGDTLSGTSTGTSTATGGGGSADTFLVQTAAAPLGIYRHRLVRTGGVANGATLRGLTQTNGVIGSADAVTQTAAGGPLFVQWYGFGRGERLYFRVTGTTSTTAPYAWTVETAAVTPVDIGSFAPGQIVITTVGQGHSTDTDLWVYDGGFNAIPLFGSDDESTAGGGTGTTLQSRLQRTFSPGHYYLALSSFNLANDQPSGPDDDFDDAAVLDFADAVLTSSSLTNVNSSFTINDSAGHSVPVAATRAGAFDVLWFAFEVGNPAPLGACCFDNGSCLEGQAAEACVTAGGVYGGDGSDCTPNACPQPGACCFGDGACQVLSASQCAAAGGAFRGGATLCDGSACIGGCCLADGACLAGLSASACVAAGGAYRGDGSGCGPPNPCPPPGACCLGDGGCQVLSDGQCSSAGGTYLGDGAACGADVCRGACCLPDDTCVLVALNECVTQGGTFRGIGAACGLPCGCFGELEPNDGKTAATVTPGLADGDCITGQSTGLSGGAVDYFKVNISPRAAGIYRHRLEYQSATPAHGATIRGLTQTSGVPNAGTDAIVQVATTATTPPRFVQWYGFGRGESFYLRVTGVATSSAPYVYSLSSELVTPQALGLFAAGEIVITTVGQGHATDTELWVYDESLNAIVGYGNDDESVAGGGTGTTLQSKLVRTYLAGRYRLALSVSNLANQLGSPADDDFRVAAVLDFPDVLVDGSAAANANVAFTISDASGAASQIAAVRAGPFDVLWFEFDVGAGTCPGDRGDANCDGSVDFFDIDPFVLALFDASGYQAAYCGGSVCTVDVSCSGAIDFFDIDPFLVCLFSGAGCAACP